ncbi:hypothetical protein Agub_g4995, partial [Astrephomene gubernaculifera]
SPTVAPAAAVVRDAGVHAAAAAAAAAAGVTGVAPVPDRFVRVRLTAEGLRHVVTAEGRQAAPEATYFRTGDLGCVGLGGCLQLLGRVDLQVKLAGVRLDLAEVEAALRGHTRVADAAVRLLRRRPHAGDPRGVGTAPAAGAAGAGAGAGAADIDGEPGVEGAEAGLHGGGAGAVTGRTAAAVEELVAYVVLHGAASKADDDPGVGSETR